MRVTEHTGSTWRRQAMAPLYGAVVAFGAVALASVFVAPEVTVRIVAAEGTTLPDDLRVELVSGTRSTGGQGPLAVVVPPQVCVRSATPVRVAGTAPATACTSAAPAGPTELTVEPVRVTVDAVRGQASQLNGAAVTVHDANGAVLQNGELEAGLFSPREPFKRDGQVCLDPPTGWTVTEPAPAGPARRSCALVTDPLADVRFRVEAS
jgi:hypothetical protein